MKVNPKTLTNWLAVLLIVALIYFGSYAGLRKFQKGSRLVFVRVENSGWMENVPVIQVPEKWIWLESLYLPARHIDRLFTGQTIEWQSNEEAGRFQIGATAEF